MKQRFAPSTLIGWLLGLLFLLLYGYTMAPTVSFWDCGEFIATSYSLGVGHPPGAPVYQLLAHLFTLLAASPQQVAFWSNSLSVLSGAFTVMFLFWTLYHLLSFADSKARSFSLSPTLHLVAAAVGASVYGVCDTAWFSVVESEVYSLSMCFSAIIVWAVVRWMRERRLLHLSPESLPSDDPLCEASSPEASTPSPSASSRSSRWLLLVAFLLGLSFCVHEMGLLSVGFVGVAFVWEKVAERKARKLLGIPSSKWSHKLALSLLAVFFFLLGTTPYVIIPLRAAAHPEINNTNPSNRDNFETYITRAQYENGPAIYPRIWRTHPTDPRNYAYWSGGHRKTVGPDGEIQYDPNFVDNIQFLFSYQIWYMYGRYLMWNFSGRYNDRQGFGTFQNGQFITGFPYVDRFIVGTGKTPPSSLPIQGHNRYFLLPLLLAVWGMVYHYRRHKEGFYSTLALFLLSGVGLAVYLNMPAFQPRERDYAFVLSFYAFSFWTAFGTLAIADTIAYRLKRTSIVGITEGARFLRWSPSLVALVPLWMALQNFDDHNRHDDYVAYDSARNLLNSCGTNSVLFTLGDNNTFKLWYCQVVEGMRPDVQIVNLSLLTTTWYSQQIVPDAVKDGVQQRGINALMAILQTPREFFFSHYAYADYRDHFDSCLQLCGIAYRLDMEAFLSQMPTDSVAAEASYRAFMQQLSMPIANTSPSGLDATSQKFLAQYLQDALLTVRNLSDHGMLQESKALVAKLFDEIPLHKIDNLTLRKQLIDQASLLSVFTPSQSQDHYQQLRTLLDQQLDYYHSIPRRQQRFIRYTLDPLESLASQDF